MDKKCEELIEVFRTLNDAQQDIIINQALFQRVSGSFLQVQLAPDTVRL